jgi:hypothetical protein
MQRSKLKIAIPSPEELVEKFFGEVLAAAAGVEIGDRSVEELGRIASLKRHPDRREAIHLYLNALKPYQQFADFQGCKSLPRPRPLELHIERSILYGYFRSWLRKQGIDPDTVDAGDDYWCVRDTDVYQSPKGIVDANQKSNLDDCSGT